MLPALTIILLGLGGWVLAMRNNMINTLGQHYVTFAEANGLRGRSVALRYAARNALLPNMTLFGLALGPSSEARSSSRLSTATPASAIRSTPPSPTTTTR